MERGHSSPWSVDELPGAEVNRLVANVTAFEIPLTRIEARFKLSQGDTSANIASAIRWLDGSGECALAELMSRYNESK
jgi:transcriptional regulator